MNMELKDELYYNDLIYKIKFISGFNQETDLEVEQRIIKREDDIITSSVDGQYLNILSTFETDLIQIVNDISNQVGITFTSITDISRYKCLVEVILLDLERKKNTCRQIIKSKSK